MPGTLAQKMSHHNLLLTDKRVPVMASGVQPQRSQAFGLLQGQPCSESSSIGSFFGAVCGQYSELDRSGCGHTASQGSSASEGVLPAPVSIAGAVPPPAWGMALRSLPAILPLLPSSNLRARGSGRVRLEGHGQDSSRSELTRAVHGGPDHLRRCQPPLWQVRGIPVGLTLQLGAVVGPLADPKVTTGTWVLSPILSTG